MVAKGWTALWKRILSGHLNGETDESTLKKAATLNRQDINSRGSLHSVEFKT